MNLKEPISLPTGTSMRRQGHVLVLSGYWTPDLMDELQYGLMDLRTSLPRAPGRRIVTLHLLNFSITSDAVSSALSLVRRTFVDLEVDVAVVAEGKLEEASLLFVAGSQQGFRKAFEDATFEVRLTKEGNQHLGFQSLPQNSSQSTNLLPELYLLPSDWQESLTKNSRIQYSTAELIKAGLVDKILAKK